MASLRAGVDADKARHVVTRLGHGRVKVWANTWGGRIEVTLNQSGAYVINVTDFNGDEIFTRLTGSIPAPIRTRAGSLKPRPTPRPKKVVRKAVPTFTDPSLKPTPPLSFSLGPLLKQPAPAAPHVEESLDTLPLTDEDRALMEGSIPA